VSSGHSMARATMAAGAERNFHTLDAMRGVAALGVVCFHLRPGWFPSAYLAVDLFFVLSGFVLSHAYDRRFAGGLSWSRFFVQRLIRLWPLYTLGVALSIVVQLYQPTVPLLPAAPLQLAMLPAPGSASGLLYPLNVPGWSLFFELLINVAWGIGWRFLQGWRLGIVIGLFALVLFLTIAVHGSADIGSFWKTALEGVPRVAFSFLVGVGISRWRPRATPRQSLALAFALLAGVGACLLVGLHGEGRTTYDMLFILAASPLLVLAASFIEPPSIMLRIFRSLGLISYPIYAIHDPLLPAFNAAATRLRVSPAIEHIAFLSCVVPLALLLAVTYDPWLRRAFSNLSVLFGRAAEHWTSARI